MNTNSLSMLLLASTTMSGCTTQKEIETSIEIDASPCAVYETLAAFDRYPEWNPYHVRVTGSGIVGEPLGVRVARPDSVVVDLPHVTLLEAEPCRALVWGGGVAGVFRGEHRFDLNQRQDGGTHLSHTEFFSGLFIGFADLPVPVLTEGYERMNEALREEVEQ